MYSLKDNGIIEEIECGSNFQYILNNKAYFVNTDYKVLQSQTNGIFVECMKMTRNGKIDLFYVTEDYRPMSSMFIGISADTLLSIGVNLFASVIEVRNNGFLACQSIDLSWDKIFVEPNTLKVKLVYLPVSVKTFDSYVEFESELRSSIVKLINKVMPDINERLNNFIMDLCNGSLSLEDVYNRSRSAAVSVVQNGEPAYNSAPTPPVYTGIKLVALNAPRYYEIVIDRDNMVLGKKQEIVDAVIPYNNMVSRRHCSITSLNGLYYIKDEDSANGTYVNNMRVAPGQYCQINRGDIVRMADSDFQIV